MTAVAAPIEKVVPAEVPEVFVAEYLDGIPMYYKGYKSILHNPAQIDEIMGAGGIHALFTIHFALLLHQILNKDEYCITGGKAGYRAEKNNLFSLDLAVYNGRFWHWNLWNTSFPMSRLYL